MFEYNLFPLTAPHLSPAFSAAFHHSLQAPTPLCHPTDVRFSRVSLCLFLSFTPQLNAAAQSPVALSRWMDLCGAQGRMGSDVSLTILEESVTCTLKAPLSCYSV